MPHEKDEAKKREEERKAWEAAIAAEEDRNAAPSTAAPSAQKKPAKEKPVKFAPTPEKSKGWAAVVEAYKVYSKKNDVDVDPKTGALVFPSRDDAITFFKAQAKLGHAFFAREYTAEGTAVDFYVLSCGDKHLYKGTLPEIKKELEAAVKKHPGDSKKLDAALEMVTKAIEAQVPSKDHAARMRGQLQDHRDEVAEQPKASTPARR